MKAKIVMLIFAVVAVALAVMLFVTRQKASTQHEEDTTKILSHSNKWVTAQENFEKELQVTATLRRDLDKVKSDYSFLSNTFSQTLDKLAASEGSLADSVVKLKAAQETITQRDARIAELQNQNSALDQQTAELSNAITNLTTQIEETQRKLTASEGDKAFLEKELQRLLAEKAELERQFNDLKVLRAQVAKLRDEMSISRRIEWIRKGFVNPFEHKGATLLLQGANAPTRQPPPAPRYDLNVEVSDDGSVRVIPPLTNAPGATPPNP